MGSGGPPRRSLRPLPVEREWQRTVYPGIPPLAWLAECSGSRITVHHGRSVETGPSHLFEGAWAGKFGELGFAQAATVVGSGAAMRGDCVIFVSPSHTLEGLFYHLSDGSLTISNSLPFLLERVGAEPRYDPHGGARFASAVLGIDRYERLVMRTNRGPVWRLLFDNLLWSGGRVQLRRKPDPFRFDDFSSYHHTLLRELEAIFANAADNARARRYLPVSTCSSGYDSTACLALARSLGCSRAVTLDQARDGQDDSGREIAAALGVELKSFGRSDDLSAEQEAAFVASGMGGEDVIYTAFEQELRGALLLTGFHGDKVWSTTAPSNPVLSRGDVSGSSMGEWRLQTDFVHLPVPFVGALHHGEIKAISNSEEMAPWSVGGSYDRPVPRRMAEQAGVPRDAFGWEKKAASALLFLEPERHSAATREQLHQRLATMPAATRLVVQARRRLFRPRLKAAYLLERASGRGGQAGSLARSVQKLVADDPRILEHDLPTASLLQAVALSAVRQRYATARRPGASG